MSLVINGKKLTEDVNALLGTDIEVPGRGIGVTIARRPYAWLYALIAAPATPQGIKGVCRGFALRDPKTFTAVLTHRQALLLLLREVVM